MEKLFLTLAAITTVGLVVYYLVSQKKLSLPSLSERKEKPKAPELSFETSPETPLSETSSESSPENN